jgi:CelD/BcsL family acetyltransferase involved in cellulose biosynthesis
LGGRSPRWLPHQENVAEATFDEGCIPSREESDTNEIMRVTLVRPQDLGGEQINCWREFRLANRLLFSPYFAPEFTLAVAAERSNTYVALVEDLESTIGFLPLERIGRSESRPVGGPLSDFQGIVTAPGLRLDPAWVLKSAGLTCWQYDHLVHTDDVWRTHTDTTSTSPYVDLARGYDDYVQQRKAAGTLVFTKTDRYERNFKKKHAELQFAFHCQDVELLNWMIRHKRNQYFRTGEVDVFGFPWTSALLRRLLESPSQDLQVVLAGLYVGGETIAAHYGLRSSGVLHSWFAAYDPAWARFRPGMILLLNILRNCSSQGVNRFDFGKGPEAYKYRFANGVTMLAEGSVDINPIRRHVRSTWRWSKNGIKRSPLRYAAKIPGRILYYLRTRKSFQ